MRHILVTSLLALMATGAMAADPMEPMVVIDETVSSSAFDWSGFYVGVVGGGGLYTANMPGTYAYYYGSYYGNQDMSEAAATIGVNAGANAQFGSFVLGIDGDVSWTNFEAASVSYDGYYGSHASWDWYATLRAKAGLAMDNTLVYVTAGLAAVNASYGACYDPDCDPVDSYDYSTTGTVLGLAVGVGAEVAVSENMSIKGEALYIGLPNTDFDTIPYSSGYNATFSSSAVIARAGLNWHFD